MINIPEKPGDRITEELRVRGWTQQVLAGVIGRPVQSVNEIINGKKEITRETAAQLGVALGVAAEVWLRMQDRYFLWQQDQDPLFLLKLDEIDIRTKAVVIKPKPVPPVYKVEWSDRINKYIATVDAHPELSATAKSGPYALRKLRTMVNAANG